MHLRVSTSVRTLADIISWEPIWFPLVGCMTGDTSGVLEPCAGLGVGVSGVDKKFWGTP